MTTNPALKIRPMLASPIQLARVEYPVWIQPKLDGIRTLARDGQGLSRTMKPIPNQWVQDWFKVYGEQLKGLDGELVVVDPVTDKVLPFNPIQSAIMSEGGAPNFKYVVFDMWWDTTAPYAARFAEAQHKVRAFQLLGLGNRIEMIFPTCEAKNEEELLLRHEQICAEGHEGSIIRFRHSRYKYGRSTAKEGHLLKFKVWQDDETRVCGFEELQHNDNPQQPDAFGLAKRSSHKANQRAGAMLGKLVVNHPKFGIFRIGSGFDMALRQEVWDDQEKYFGQFVTFKYQPHGMKDKPRSPIFKGFRHPDDIGDPK